MLLVGSLLEENRFVIRSLMTLICVFLAATATATHLDEVKLLYNFQGKGSSLSYDAGAFTQSFAMIPAIRDGQVVLSANSGGAILAAFFTCHGINKDSIAKIRKVLVEGTDRVKSSVQQLRDTVENPVSKVKMLTSGKIPYIDIKNLDAYIEAALNIASVTEIAHSSCKFEVPIVIVASNYEVVHNFQPGVRFARMDGGIESAAQSYSGGSTSLDEKFFTADDFVVRWKKESFDRLAKLVGLEAGFKRFQESHPDLMLGESDLVGKSCTYFVSPDVYELFAQMPVEERLCDLRLVDDAASLALAIQASAAEPTYFAPIPETVSDKLLVDDGRPGHLGVSTKRSYWGGFVMPMVAHDIRRALPHLRVLGSGTTRLDLPSNSVVRSLALVDTLEVSKVSEYWADVAFVPKSDYRSKLKALVGSRPSQGQEFDMGLSRALECLTAEKNGGKRCLPESVSPPLWDTPAFPTEDFPADEPLERGRGLGDLI